MKTILKLIATFCLILFQVSCSLAGHDGADGQELCNYTVALIVRHNAGQIEKWHQTAEWALESFAVAQEGYSKAIKLNFEWYDENTVDLDSLAMALKDRNDVCCVIGPQASGKCDIVANILQKTRKTMIAPCATSAELVRSYVGSDFFWAMVEPDITQCEILLTQLIAYGYKDVSLLASTSLYGSTFVDWFSYQATELGLNVRMIYKYDDDPDNSTLASLAEKAFAMEQRDDNYAIIATPTDSEGAKVILEKYHAAGENAPRLMFSDIAITDDILQWGEIANFAEGVAPYADPESGFSIAYKARFGNNPGSWQSQFYDALMIVQMALSAMEAGFGGNLNEAIKYIVNTSNEDGSERIPLSCWRPENISRILASIWSGKMAYNISGTSGPLDFDSRQYTAVIHSIYAHWLVYNGSVLALDFLSPDGSNRIESSLASWEWNTSVQQEFYDVQPFIYPDRTDNWALVVAGSKGWINYRHQADALNIYQILKTAGYDDDHIVLIMEDDLASNPDNPKQGSVKRYDGQELYTNLKIDYHISDLTPDDIIDILLGRRSERLPAVISSNPGSNVAVFWSGHGEPGSILMEERPAEEGLTESKMEELLTAVYQAGCYRKMLWFIETCYSASVAIAAQNLQVPGVMMFTAASAWESSKADVKKDGVWMTNRFTKTLMEVVTAQPDIDFRELYLELNRLTTGSHVCVLNSTNFDSLYRTNLQEFIHPAR